MELGSIDRTRMLVLRIASTTSNTVRPVAQSRQVKVAHAPMSDAAVRCAKNIITVATDTIRMTERYPLRTPTPSAASKCKRTAANTDHFSDVYSATSPPTSGAAA